MIWLGGDGQTNNKHFQGGGGNCKNSLGEGHLFLLQLETFGIQSTVKVMAHSS